MYNKIYNIKRNYRYIHTTCILYLHTFIGRWNNDEIIYTFTQLHILNFMTKSNAIRKKF